MGALWRLVFGHSFGSSRGPMGRVGFQDGVSGPASATQPHTPTRPMIDGPAESRAGEGPSSRLYRIHRRTVSGARLSSVSNRLRVD